MKRLLIILILLLICFNIFSLNIRIRDHNNNIIAIILNVTDIEEFHSKHFIIYLDDNCYSWIEFKYYTYEIINGD